MLTLHGKMRPKWPQAALWAENVQEAIWAVIFNTRAQKPPCSFLHLSHLSMSLLDKMAPPSSPMAQEAPRHSLARSCRTVNGQSLAPSWGEIRLSTNTRIVQPSSPCREKASRNALLLQPPSPHSFCTAPSSCPGLILTQSSSLTSRPLIIHSRGVAC